MSAGWSTICTRRSSIPAFSSGPRIRTRALPRTIYRIADGNPDNVFLHIIARIRAGRSVEDRKGLGNALLQTAKTVLGASSRPIALGVEIHEIDPQMLFRHITIK